ncbi:MAG: hypothetical protein K2M17_03725 [Bacilli bacterium]|nr:hypothetical protein [Bacilli bacterium]
MKKLKQFGYEEYELLENDTCIYTTIFPYDFIDDEIKNRNVTPYFRSITEEDFDECDFKEWIDCGTDEQLFLALAAMREDSDKYQYFVREEALSLVNLGIHAPVGAFVYSLIDKWGTEDFHKASVKEIINYFKKERFDGV